MKTEGKNGGGQSVDYALKSELLHALFVLKNLHFHRLGRQGFGLRGGGRRGGVGCGPGGFGFNMTEFAFLKQLQLREERGENGGAWLQGMRDYLCVSKAAVSQMLGALEGRELITRETDPENRRTIIVSLTVKGREVIESFENGFDDHIELMIGRFGEKDTREIIRLIYKFADIAESFKDEEER